MVPRGWIPVNLVIGWHFLYSHSLTHWMWTMYKPANDHLFPSALISSSTLCLSAFSKSPIATENTTNNHRASNKWKMASYHNLGHQRLLSFLLQGFPLYQNDTWLSQTFLQHCHSHYCQLGASDARFSNFLDPLSKLNFETRLATH